MNLVLRGLRLTELASSTTALTDEVHLKILDHLNYHKDNVEASWDWNALRATVTVTGAASTAEYTLTTSGSSDVSTSERSRLLYEKSLYGIVTETTIYSVGAQPCVYDTTTSGAEFRMIEKPAEWIRRKQNVAPLTDSQATYFALEYNPASVHLIVYPTPTQARTWVMRFVNPQDRLDSETMSTVISVPDNPVYLYALADMQADRGEDRGEASMRSEMRAHDALAVAIARERTDAEQTGYPV